MFRKDGKFASSALVENSQDQAYGCCFCLTGKEKLAASHLCKAFPEVKAITASRLKHKSVQGQKSRIEESLLPGYIFFCAPSDFMPNIFFSNEYILRVLTTDDGIWQLSGEDRRFAQWLFQYNGLLGFSQFYQEGEKIHIISGPLKDMEGQIVRIDKRGCSGQVILKFNGRCVPVWLGFDIIRTVV